MKAVLSISGGMDSTCLLIKLLSKGFDVHCISFDYGQKHKLELKRLDENLKYIKSVLPNVPLQHTRIDLKSAMSSLHSALTSEDVEMPKGYYENENMKETVVPNRNAIFSSIIYAHALSIAKKYDTEIVISLGVHSGDHAIYPDCRPDFYHSIMTSFCLGNWYTGNISWSLPYIDVDKAEILRQCLEDSKKLGLDFNTLLKNTNTSYLPDDLGRADGKTGSDIERILAFYEIGRVDPVEYQDDWETVLQNALQAQREHV